MIGIRVLTADDWRRWRELRLAALAEAPYAFGATLAQWQGDGDREERWRARLSIPGSRNVLALLDGVPAGMAAVPCAAAGTISLWVGGAGPGRGVGDRLIREVEEWAVRERAEVLRLAVAHGNEHALALYRRHGFAPAGRPDAAAPDGRPEQIMEKRLRAG
ncbi:GNAT family N-acetyltransferase [Streptomyces pactum]|uniref:GNAT family N-acetyltransferase n=1 Tax=Streptomyces pactum TaxID=68249 RepID=A0ABS0NPS5_9ACTN|nr:GNAT family N-acetyltransferase [Streptomyces pactum]MBH5337211.1 GNAT family N-acetyltransferase [Streptomyces pactum]